MRLVAILKSLLHVYVFYRPIWCSALQALPTVAAAPSLSHHPRKSRAYTKWAFKGPFPIYKIVCSILCLGEFIQGEIAFSIHFSNELEKFKNYYSKGF